MWSLLAACWVGSCLAVFPLLFAEGRRDRTDEELGSVSDRAERIDRFRS